MLSLFFISTSAFAQFPSNNGEFTVSALEACERATISIVNPCANCADYDFDNDGNGDGTSFQYTSPGNYTIEAFAAGGNITDQVNISIYADTIPQFEVFRCTGRTVEVVVNDDNYDSYEISWGDGNQSIISGSDNQELHTYAASGNRTITVQGLYDQADGAGNCTPNQALVEVVENLPQASISEVYPPNNQTDRVVIRYSAPVNVQYRLQLAINNSTNWIPGPEIDAAGDSVILTNIDTENNYYCLRIAAIDVCQPGNPVVTTSQVVCTSSLMVNFTTNEENILSWQTNSVNLIDFNVRIDEDGNLSSPSFGSSTRSYTHNSVTCNTNYCYSIISNYPGGTTVRSVEICGLAELNIAPPAIANLATSVDENSISIDWPDPPANIDVSGYRVFRNVDGNDFALLTDNLDVSQYVDTGLNTSSARYCYRISYIDECNNLSANSRDICAILLTGSGNASEVNLNWNAYNGYAGGVSEYRVSRFDSNGALLGTFTTTSTNFNDMLDENDPQELLYRVTAVPNESNFGNSISNFYRVVRLVNIVFPNAINPSSNGENSRFRIQSPFLSGVELKIFNRWGQLIYVTDDMENGWGGTDMDGNPLPQGTYIYTADLFFENGDESQAKGSIYLLRR